MALWFICLQVFPTGYLQYEREIRELEGRSDDVWVSSFPKCGTTWTQEMVWNILNNVDLDTAKSVKLTKGLSMNVSIIKAQDL